MMPAPLSFSDYPGLDPAEEGIVPNMGYGALEGIRCPCVDAGAAFVLASPVSIAGTVISVTDASRLPAPPFTLQAGAEQMRATLVDGSQITVTRGYGGTQAAVHPAGRTLFEVRDRYVYLVADHPVRSISALYVDGSRILEGYSAYTGQQGDELGGYEGRAVVSLEAAPHMGRQFNLTRHEAAERASGREEQARPRAWSSRDLVDGCASTFTLAHGAQARPTAWVGFLSAYPSVLGQRYAADVENPSADDARVRLAVTQGGLHLASREFIVPGGGRALLTLWRGPGQEEDELVLTPMGAQVRVYSMAKTLTLDDSLMPVPQASMELLPSAIRGPRYSILLRALGRSRLRADYPEGPSGAVKAETHEIRVTEATGTGQARVRVAAGQCSFGEALIAPGATETISLNFEGGAWETTTIAVVLSGEVTLSDMRKRVEYYPETGGEPSMPCSARLVVGEDVRVDAELAVDTEGSYAGAGTLIERPDHVMRHYLLNHMGFSPEDIEAGSFDESGSLYSSAVAGGYRMAFLIDAALAPSGLLTRMARESRSVIHFGPEGWGLAFLPDEAPEPVRTITSGELAGRGSMFTFERTPLGELANTLTARYGPQRNLSSESAEAWLGVLTASDSGSIALYGEYAREVELALIRHRETADSVLGHMLMQRSRPLMRVRFPVFYEHFDLGVGQTIETDSPLYAGRRFFIERITRLDKFRAEMEALEWW